MNVKHVISFKNNALDQVILNVVSVKLTISFKNQANVKKLFLKIFFTMNLHKLIKPAKQNV